jgi:hypothetical protein
LIIGGADRTTDIFVIFRFVRPNSNQYDFVFERFVDAARHILGDRDRAPPRTTR